MSQNGEGQASALPKPVPDLEVLDTGDQGIGAVGAPGPFALEFSRIHAEGAGDVVAWHRRLAKAVRVVGVQGTFDVHSRGQGVVAVKLQGVRPFRCAICPLGGGGLPGVRIDFDPRVAWIEAHRAPRCVHQPPRPCLADHLTDHAQGRGGVLLQACAVAHHPGRRARVHETAHGRDHHHEANHQPDHEFDQAHARLTRRPHGRTKLR